MSRLTVVRRLAAVTALLAIFCLALPAAAAPGAHRQPARAHVAQASGLVDQFLAWLGGFWTGPSQGGKAPTEKAGIAVPILTSTGGSASLAPPPNNTDKSGTIDPNG